MYSYFKLLSKFFNIKFLKNKSTAYQWIIISGVWMVIDKMNKKPARTL
jgi:hypothetical protein